MLEFPQPRITKGRTAEAASNGRRARRGTANRISPSYNRVRLSGRAKAKCYFCVACIGDRVSAYGYDQVPAARACYFSVIAAGKRPLRRLVIFLGCPSTAKQRAKSRSYFFLDSFFASPLDSVDSLVARLDSPGRYSSCSAAAKAFSNPTISSPGRSVSKDSTSLRSCSSE